MNTENRKRSDSRWKINKTIVKTKTFVTDYNFNQNKLSKILLQQIIRHFKP